MNPGVEKVEIEAPNGNEILTTVHINSVDSEETGIAIATKLHIAAMDRICFFPHGSHRERPRHREQFFSGKSAARFCDRKGLRLGCRGRSLYEIYASSLRFQFEA